MTTRSMSYEEMFGWETSFTRVLLAITAFITAFANKINSHAQSLAHRYCVQPLNKVLHICRPAWNLTNNILFQITAPIAIASNYLALAWAVAAKPFTQFGKWASKCVTTRLQTERFSNWLKKKLEVTPSPTRHPWQIYLLGWLEMFERFAFYLMGNLLALYLMDKYGMSEKEAASIVGTYNAFVYLSPFFGGVGADRWLGYRRSVLMGTVLLAAGYFLFAFCANLPGKNFLAGMVVIVIGNGLFKPNISTMVSNLYPQGDARRDSAFSLFYMFINIGAMPSGPVGELLHEHYSWGTAFAAAGVAMIISSISLVIFYHHLQRAESTSSLSAAVGGIPLPKEYADKPEDPKMERLRLVATIILLVIVMFFWMGFQQNQITLTFWAANSTERTIHIGARTWEIAPGSFQVFNSIFVIGLTPLQVLLMKKLNARKMEPSTPTKMVLGMLFGSAAFLVMAAASLLGGNHGKVHMAWLIGCYFVITIGELLLSPMGLSLVTKLAPPRMRAMMLGAWFISSSAGNYLAGKIGWMWQAWQHSNFFFAVAGVLALMAGLLLTQHRRMNTAINSTNVAPDPNGGKTAEEIAAAAEPQTEEPEKPMVWKTVEELQAEADETEKSRRTSGTSAALIRRWLHLSPAK